MSTVYQPEPILSAPEKKAYDRYCKVSYDFIYNACKQKNNYYYHSKTLYPRILNPHRSREKHGEDPAPVKWRDWYEVKDREHGIDYDTVIKHIVYVRDNGDNSGIMEAFFILYEILKKNARNNCYGKIGQHSCGGDDDCPFSVIP